MLRELNVNWIKWIDAVWLSKDEIREILINHEIHELDLEACLEENQRARIDNYDKYSFAIFHFPKYDINLKTYKLNEINIFLWKNTLITFRDFPWTHIDIIFSYYENLKVRKKDHIKITSGYIVYEMTQSMLEKMFKLTKNVSVDIKWIEQKVFDTWNSSLVKDIMIKKRNIVVLKHMFRPQILVFKKLETTINELYESRMEEYFEDLEDKVEQLVNDIWILWEHIDTVEDAFKSMVDIKTNFTMKILTIFSAFLMPLTLVTSFYWMNIKLPFDNNPYFVYGLILGSAIFMLAIFFYFKKIKKF